MRLFALAFLGLYSLLTLATLATHAFLYHSYIWWLVLGLVFAPACWVVWRDLVRAAAPAEARWVAAAVKAPPARALLPVVPRRRSGGGRFGDRHPFVASVLLGRVTTLPIEDDDDSWLSVTTGPRDNVRVLLLYLMVVVPALFPPLLLMAADAALTVVLYLAVWLTGRLGVLTRRLVTVRLQADDLPVEWERGAPTRLPSRRGRVLYLRSFRTDPVLQSLGTPALPRFLTAEEALVAGLDGLGQVVAVGETRRLPTPGAVRLKTGRDWQDAVGDLMAEARVVALVADTTPGIRWELQEAVSRLGPERLVVILVGGPDRYEQFRTELAPLFPHGLPPYPPGPPQRPATVGGVLLFDAGWRGRVTRLDAGTAGTVFFPGVLGPWLHALSPLYERLDRPVPLRRVPLGRGRSLWLTVRQWRLIREALVFLSMCAVVLGAMLAVAGGGGWRGKPF